MAQAQARREAHFDCPYYWAKYIASWPNKSWTEKAHTIQAEANDKPAARGRTFQETLFESDSF